MIHTGRVGRVFACLCVPVCVIGLTSAGYGVADTCASSRIHVLNHDEGMLLQRGHGQMAVVGHMLQVAAIPRPDGIANLKDAPSERPHLNGEGGRENAHWYHEQACLSLSCDLHVNLFSFHLFFYFFPKGWQI